MSVPPLLNAAGRRRSPVTLPGYLAGRPPRNKGLRYPPDPHTVEEIVAVMRQAGDRVHGARMRALIVLLWRAGLRINEALTLTERDLEAGAGSVGGCATARAAAGARSAWTAGAGITSGPGSSSGWVCRCVVEGRTRGRPWAAAASAQLRRVAAKAGVRRRFAPHQLRHTHAVELAHEGVPLNVIQRRLGTHQPRGHLHLSAGDRQRRDHRHRQRPQGADDPR
jgi:integrase